MWPDPQFPADLVTFTEEILNGKLHFLSSEIPAVRPLLIFIVIMIGILAKRFGRTFHLVMSVYVCVYIPIGTCMYAYMYKYVYTKG